MKTPSQPYPINLRSHSSPLVFLLDLLKERIKIYRELAKSGIVTLVIISVTAGFFISHSLESSFPIDVFFLTFFGILFLSSGSSALNQIQEIEIDRKMPRTQKRPLVTQRISVQEAILFSSITCILGLILLFQVSMAVFILGILAMLSYNVLYTLWWKKKNAFAAIPGAIPGALPIYMGSVAASGELLAPTGIYLFLILFIWQMPHFWVLALHYKEDYSLGGIPTLPVELGKEKTIQQIDLWALAYVGLALLAPLFIHGIGVFYHLVALVTSLKILYELLKFHRSQNQVIQKTSWIHFFLWVNFSLIIYLAAIALNHWGIYLLIPLLT